MLKVRIHGRAGQGSVSAAYILAKSGLKDGKCTQAFPAFGANRRGAPTKSFVRIAEEPIKKYYQIYNPDIVLVLDETVPNYEDGLKKEDKLIVNSKNGIEKEPYDTYTLNATEIVKEFFDTSAHKQYYNTPMLGALVGITNLVNFESLSESIREIWSGEVAEKDVKMAKKAYKKVRGEENE